jgi:hypothetical protein
MEDFGNRMLHVLIIFFNNFFFKSPNNPSQNQKITKENNNEKTKMPLKPTLVFLDLKNNFII